MKNLTKTITASEIRNLNLNENDVMAFDFLNENGIDHNYILINGNRILSFQYLRDSKKSYNKIQRMGLALGWLRPQLTDEQEGIIQASENGDNPFACEIIYANLDNKIVY